MVRVISEQCFGFDRTLDMIYSEGNTNINQLLIKARDTRNNFKREATYVIRAAESFQKSKFLRLSIMLKAEIKDSARLLIKRLRMSYDCPKH